MTDVTDLGEIWVVGQRRRPGGSFPSGGGSGGGGDTGVPQQNELGESEPEEPPPHPCDSPQTALPWNADAAAAAAIEAFLEAAASLGFAEHPTGHQVWQIGSLDADYREDPAKALRAMALAGVPR